MSRLLRLTMQMSLVGLAAVMLISSVGCASGTAPQRKKIKVASLDDLPRHAYQIDGKVSELLKSDAGFAALAKQVRADVENDLATYEINDAATLQGFYSTLLALDMLESRYDDALARVEKIRALEDKEAARIMTGLSTRAMIVAARETAGGVNDAAYQAAFRKHLAASVKDLPWDVVQDRVKEAKGMAEVLSENLLIGMVQGQMDPIVAKAGEISSDLAARVVSLRYVLVLRLPLNPVLASVYQEKIDAHRVVKKDIWADRSVTLDRDRELEPVVVAIWDSGVDASVFDGHLFVNAGEKLDGTDTDGNGFVDDRHGIAYDVDGRVSSELLHPPGDMAGRIEAAMGYMKGFMDVQAAIESDEATALKKHLSGLNPEEIEGFIEGLSFCGQWAHGTHVAGIATAGNPFAQVLIARITFDYHTIPQPVTVEIARRHAESYHAAAEYFKQHGVRVANMSWGWTLKEIESSLEANNVGASPDERAELAGEVLSILSKGLRDAIASAPEILFVSAAGNDDNDVEFDQVIPSSFELPNLLIVGAVDQAGEPTSFTSSGRNVVVYANGFEVESYVPGGQRMKMSGTSMSSPNVTNLAAKLIALEPELTPAEVIELIEEGADRKEGALSYLLLNPKRSVELLEAK